MKERINSIVLYQVFITSYKGRRGTVGSTSDS